MNKLGGGPMRRCVDSGTYAERFWLAVLLLAAAVAPAAAQPRFRLGSWTGMTELRFDFQEQETDFLFGRDSLFDRQLSEERLALRNTLTVVDRRFLIINYGFTLGLLQSQLTADELEARGEGELRALDLTATYRPLSPHRVTLFFNRSQNETPVEFAGTRVLDSRGLGLSLVVGPKALPGNLSIRQSEIESISEFGDSIRGLDQLRRILEYSASNRWQRHDLFASYRFEEVTDRVAPRFSHKSQSLNLNHSFELLAPGLASLSSIFRVFDRSGELTSSSLYLDEVLRLRHRKNLSSSVRWVAQQLDSFSGPASDSQRLFLGLHHRLYDSLETDVLAGRTQTSSGAGRGDLEELGFDTAYRKRLPWDGRLTAHLSARYEVRDNLRGAGQELVSGERHVAHFGVPVRLERPGVIADSLVVTDELRATIFEERIDYELLLIADFAEIQPLEGGRIREGQILLVEYRVEVPSSSKSKTLRTAFDMALDYGWIAPFWGLRSVDRRLVEGLGSRLLEDQEDRILGVRFKKIGRRFHLVSFNELRIRDSDLLSFETIRLGQSLTYRPFRRWTLRLNVALLDTRFTDFERQTRVSDGRLRLRWTPLPALSLESYLDLRALEDTAAADQRFERYGFEGRWTLGKITLLASVERWRRERLENDVAIDQFSGRTASLRISRRFFPGRLSAPRRLPEPEPWPQDLPGLWSEPQASDPAAGSEGGGVEGAEEDP